VGAFASQKLVLATPKGSSAAAPTADEAARQRIQVIRGYAWRAHASPPSLGQRDHVQQADGSCSRPYGGGESGGLALCIIGACRR